MLTTIKGHLGEESVTHTSGGGFVGPVGTFTATGDFLSGAIEVFDLGADILNDWGMERTIALELGREK